MVQLACVWHMQVAFNYDEYLHVCRYVCVVGSGEWIGSWDNVQQNIYGSIIRTKDYVAIFKCPGIPY